MPDLTVQSTLFHPNGPRKVYEYSVYHFSNEGWSEWQTIYRLPDGTFQVLTAADFDSSMECGESLEDALQIAADHRREAKLDR